MRLGGFRSLTTESALQPKRWRPGAEEDASSGKTGKPAPTAASWVAGALRKSRLHDVFGGKPEEWLGGKFDRERFDESIWIETALMERS